MGFISAISKTFSVRTDVFDEVCSSVWSIDTLDRTTSSDDDASLNRDCDDTSTTSDDALRHVQQNIAIQEEEDGAISLVFVEKLSNKKTSVESRRVRSRRGRSRHRRKSGGPPTNADLTGNTAKEIDPVQSYTTMESSASSKKRRGRKLGKALQTSLRSVKGEIHRFQKTREHEMLVIHPVGTFEMHQELDLKLSTVTSLGL